jgi:hypothetical protein
MRKVHKTVKRLAETIQFDISECIPIVNAAVEIVELSPVILHTTARNVTAS